MFHSTGAATVPAAAEESRVSAPFPGSAAPDAAVAKTESLESNKETQAAQESRESAPVAKQERTGTQTRVWSAVQLSSSTSRLAAGLCIHFFICRFVSAVRCHPCLHSPLLICFLGFKGTGLSPCSSLNEFKFHNLVFKDGNTRCENLS